jgi:hypothetical protein
MSESEPNKLKIKSKGTDENRREAMIVGAGFPDLPSLRNESEVFGKKRGNLDEFVKKYSDVEPIGGW